MEKFRFSEKDIFYANESNAFVINDKTIRLSLKSDKFVFYCYYQTPYINNLKIEYEWKNKLITIDDLKFDKKTYKIYYYDLDTKKQILNIKILNEKNSKKYPWIKDFWAKLETCGVYDYKIILTDLQRLSTSLDTNHYKLIRVIFILYSLKKQKVFGYDNKNIVWLLNNSFEHHEEYAHIFLKMITVRNMWEFILKEDKKDVFKNKVKRYKQNNITKENEYNKLLSILFPELIS